MATAKQQDSGEYEVELTAKGKWALAIEMLERAARLIGVPTTPDELAAYVAAKQRYDAVESSFCEQRRSDENMGGALNDADRGW